MADRDLFCTNILAVAVAVVALCLASSASAATTYNATTYTVGDNSGWDISSDLDTWSQDKTFNVGDSLLFQYTSSETVEEVNDKPAFDSCNTTEATRTFNNGNTTVLLDRPGPWYFICGNRLYCLGGMKLQVNVAGDADSPVGSPEAEPSNPSSKSNLPNSSGFVVRGRGREAVLMNVVVGIVAVASLFWVVHV